MLDQKQRAAILALHQSGQGTRSIARALKVSRTAVKDVLGNGSVEVPPIVRPQLAEPWREEILALHALCKGNLVRVHEELVNKGAALSYPALTAFCRRSGIGYKAPEPAGRYSFAPGQEMQHDTSPHRVRVGGAMRQAQTASLVLCYSRMLFFQIYPRFTRFECKLFLTEAFQYLGGLAGRCEIDNTHVVVLKGSGAQMVPVPEMAAFAERYSVPYQLIGRRMEVRETKDCIEVFDGPRMVASHKRVLESRDAFVTDKKHRPPRGQGRSKDAPAPEETELLKAEPSLATYVAALKRHASGRGTLSLRRLLKMVRDYPREPLRAAIARAEQYGLFDLDRLDRMVLGQIATDYFVLPVQRGEKEPDDE